MHPYLDWPGPIAMAHRGGASDAPENTMPAFQSAVDLGYRYVETDAQATADGVVLAFHDDDLQRTCSRPGRISTLPIDDVATARVWGKEPIPRLEELLMAFPGTRFNIDCKTDATVQPLVDVLTRLDVLDRVCVAAFADRRIRRLRCLLGPDACTALGQGEIARLKFQGMARHGNAAQVPVRTGRLTIVTPRLLRRAHAGGIAVHVWTIDDADEMHRLLDLGVGGVLTDRPGVLKDVLTERGEWHE
ncbi:MAG: glycerophosphodiester phosphodiesterase [Actinomycetota bacterium]|nr:glycerophosphodiester phosphodiesterase [Actinomycetota bacterium]